MSPAKPSAGDAPPSPARALRWAPWAGLALAAAAIIAGMILSMATGRPIPEHVVALPDVWRLVLRHDPAALMSLGFLILVALPIGQLMATAFGFIRSRDWRFAALSLVVLAILIGSMWAGH